jgi:sulfoxide reductase heme-binding subunit YedZ
MTGANMKQTHKPRFTPLQITVHVAGWFPLVRLMIEYFTQHLTANPVQALEQHTGIQALIFLLLSLSCTPLASIFGWKELTQRRKALGNYGFLYAALHVLTFFVIDYGLNLDAVWEDIRNKPYIIIGATAFLMLLPLAFTSFKYWQKRLGKNWKRLHRLVYIISPLVVLHFLLTIKGNFLRLYGNFTQPLIYGGVVLILLLVRIKKIKLALLGLRGRIEASRNAMHLSIKLHKQKQDIQ